MDSFGTSRRAFVAFAAGAILSLRAAANGRRDLDEMRAGRYYEFLSRKHPNSLDVNLVVRLPRSFVHYSNDQANVVREFSHPRWDELQVGGNLYVFEQYSGSTLNKVLPRNPRHLSVTKTKVGDLLASIRKYRFDLPATDDGLPGRYFRCQMLAFQTGRRFVAMALGVGGAEGQTKDIDDVYVTYEPVFDLTFAMLRVEA